MCPAARYACFPAGHADPALQDSSAAALTGRRPLRTFIGGVPCGTSRTPSPTDVYRRRIGSDDGRAEKMPPRRRDFLSCRWQTDDGVSGIRRGGLTMAGRKISRRHFRVLLLRYCIASARCAASILSAPSRSAMVRAMRRMRSWLRPVSPRRSKAPCMSFSPAASSAQY